MHTSMVIFSVRIPEVVYRHIGVFIEKHMYTKFRLDCCCSELHAHLCRHRIKLFILVSQELNIVDMLVSSESSGLSLYQVSLLCTFQSLR